MVARPSQSAGFGGDLRVARLTGGQSFRASDVGTAEAAFQAIDKTNKIEFQAKSYLLTTELFLWPVGVGLLSTLAAGMMFRRS